MGGSGSFENQKERFHPGHHQELVLGAQRLLKLVKLWQASGTLSHPRFTMQFLGLSLLHRASTL